MLQIVIGTAGNVNCVSDSVFIDEKGRVHTGCFIDRCYWICSGVLQASGRSLSWWSEIIGSSVEELTGEVDLAAPSGVVFAPYLSGERTPHLDARVRGAFVMLSANTSRAAMTQAVLEGVVFSLRDAAEVFYGMNIQPERFTVTGGGVQSNALCQILANTLGFPIFRIRADITVRGAAILAACSCGQFTDWQDAVQNWSPEGELFQPRNTDSYEEAFRRFQALYPHIAQYSSHQGGLQ